MEKFKLQIRKKEEEIGELKKKIETSENKGKLCSKKGLEYEKIVYNIVKNLSFNNKPFNTQNEKELGGSSSELDLKCNFLYEYDIGIEIKKCNTPDWMQCSIKYDKERKKWHPTSRGFLPIECVNIFENLLNNINLYGGKIPPFMEKNITHQEWLDIKSKTKIWNDCYLDIPNDTIQTLYKYKGCSYIQISDYGLYCLDDDICNFNVPKLKFEQQLRIRTKIHTKKNKNGFCVLSITASCKPKNIKSLLKSPFSLDNIGDTPNNLVIILL